MRNSILILLCFCMALALSQPVWAKEKVGPTPLRVLYLEFPPYYYTNSSGEPEGFLLKKADELFRSVGFEPTYTSMPARRILLEMRGLNPACSIGWFKTPEREKYAKFSKPFYRNRPLQALFLRDNAMLFHGKDTLLELMMDNNLVLGKLNGYSFGPVVDHLVKEIEPKSQVVVGGHPQLIRLLAEGRFSYILVAPEEIGTLIEKNHLSPEFFESKMLTDIPAGNLRHLMFSRGMTEDVVIQLNRVIESVE